MKGKKLIGILLPVLALNSCFREIDTEPIPLPEVEDYFIVQQSIKQVQSFFRFYENTVVEVKTASPFSWDLAFESAGNGSRVLDGWGTFSQVHPGGVYDMAEVSQELIIDLIDNSDDWVFDDPSYVNTYDSLALTGHWEDGEVWIVNRGRTDDNYYAIQYVSSDEESYRFRYASARDLGNVKEATIYRSNAYNYVYFSFDTGLGLTMEPPSPEWDILCTPYRGWWETDNPGIYAPFNVSGILINNENGVRIAHVFDPEVAFEDLDYNSIASYEFTDMKGAVGADWKVLGGVNSGNIFSVNPDMKYLMKKYDLESNRNMYFKFRIIDYKLDGVDHHPTIEFSFLGAEQAG